ncbi:hypothetical protein A1O7_00222 [Cladophialophora yegresii CBS 114405]|uniref:Atos-like conserved domain-containing protein n=1 Tax=Cladophialophora yegresii CBS 114405 TaxID=1182544 RepID=W9W734_9EURO|nr:uncharacterized protein A1O7_00222 [Cladophialophora yegresii CBS 114405]EXJ63887.1 hypothetical protein A1O7_00222 [Cladophialophora yegresii CBS 114405]
MARYSTPQPDDIEEQFLFEPAEASEGHSAPRRDDCKEREQVTVRTSDREELIQCIKRGQRTTWVPKPGLEALCAEVASTLPQSNNPNTGHVQDAGQETDVDRTQPTLSIATYALRRSLSVLRTSDLTEDCDVDPTVPDTHAETSMPWNQNYQPHFDRSHPFWQADSPATSSLQQQQGSPTDMLRRARAPSLGSGLSSSFVMRIPTSPLVHAINNPTLDFSPKDSPRLSTGKTARRRTMPPNVFESLRMSPAEPAAPSFSRPSPHGQGLRDSGGSFSPGHRMRRSLSSFTYQPATPPQIPPWTRQRRTSLAADMSPRQRASMVGSFEESILRGRMSTPASKPLDFVAQIGVMGKGDCPARLKCPAHVTVTFPAVFYNYPSANSSRSISDDNPSPYVGSIDLERNLKASEPRRRSQRSQASLNPEELAAEITKPENTAIGRALAKETRDRQEKNLVSQRKIPPGGAYRVPQKGQLQVIIKNPNKTAVKLFLVPYDLEDMLPGTKTFVRQRSYSTGPILEAATLEKQAALAALDPLSAKDILRYLIHIKFCCTAKGYFYLYDTIRVVFANRAPDGTEKLRNEVQLPDPRFSPYKPTTGSHSRSPSIPDEKVSSFSMVSVTPDFEYLDDMTGSGAMKDDLKATRESSPTPVHLYTSPIYQSDTTKVTENAHAKELEEALVEGTVSPTPGFLPSTSSRSSPVPWPSSNSPSLARGFSPAPVEAGHGLLSRKLKELNGVMEKPFD